MQHRGLVGLRGQSDVAETRVCGGICGKECPFALGSLAKMHRWFTESLEPSYQQWLSYVKQPGVRCVDETTYCARWHQILVVGRYK